MQAENLKRAMHGFSGKMRLHLETLVSAAALTPELIDSSKQTRHLLT
jgi:hypothetical protein